MIRTTTDLAVFHQTGHNRLEPSADTHSHMGASGQLQEWPGRTAVAVCALGSCAASALPSDIPAEPGQCHAPPEVVSSWQSSWDFFSNYGHYMPRVHCLQTADGSPDWPWIGVMLGLTATVTFFYCRIFFSWRRAYLAEASADRNRKLMDLGWIFLICGITSYGLSMVIFFWPVYRLQAVLLLVLAAMAWRFSRSISELSISLAAPRLERERDEAIRRAVAEAREDTDAMMRDVASTVPGAIYRFEISPEGVFSFAYVSDGVQRIYGVSPQEAKSRFESVVELVHPDDLQELMASIERVRESKGPWVHEYRVRARDGVERWIRGQSVPNHRPDGVLAWHGVFLDITEDAARLREKLMTGHAEAVEVVYDPKVVRYEQLVDYFWRTIDPTTKDRQFCDGGCL